MQIIKGKFGECRLCDNMDEKAGMPSLEAGSWDLCLTDYPYNVKFTGKAFGGTEYSDTKTAAEYQAFCQRSFIELTRITKGQIIFCGNMNLNMWIKSIAEPLDVAFHYAPNKQSRGKGYMCPKHEVILLYNEIQLGKSVYKFNTEFQLIKNHPCPNNPKLYRALIQDSGYHSVLDPFLGSGTTAQVCEELGIPWLGYELNVGADGNPAGYDLAIKQRIANGIAKHRTNGHQMTLFPISEKV